MGLSGLPVYADFQSGFHVLFGPTSGYLISLIPSAYIIGKLVEVKNDFSFRWLLLSMALGTTIVYVLGIFQLINWMHIGIIEAIVLGILPFLLGDSLKMLAAAYVASRVKRVLPQIISAHIK